MSPFVSSFDFVMHVMCCGYTTRTQKQELLRKEKEIERKERRAERDEQIYLAEERQEQIILQQKEEAARKEEKKFIAVQEEYESVAELAKEEEVELRYVILCILHDCILYLLFIHVVNLLVDGYSFHYSYNKKSWSKGLSMQRK